ncbi:MAG: TadE/TadG family type IV pilus assembly protein [Pseudomonadota bacterium]
MNWLQKLRNWRKREDGSSTIEFVLYFPLFFTFLATGIDNGLVMIKHVSLERGLTSAVRNISLNTLDPPSYNEVKTLMCKEMGMIQNCHSALRLEMIRVDPNAGTVNIPQTPSCNNTPEDIVPPRTFENGGDNELMFVRACVMIRPLLPGFGWGGMNWFNPNGEAGKELTEFNRVDKQMVEGKYIPLVAMASYVTEPV